MPGAPVGMADRNPRGMVEIHSCSGEDSKSVGHTEGETRGMQTQKPTILVGSYPLS